MKDNNEKDITTDGKKKKPKRNGSRAYRVLYPLLSGIVGFLFNIKVINKENEPDEKSYVICANHVSATDPIALCYAFRKNQVRFMAKKELFKIPVLSGVIKLFGAFPVDRASNDVGAVKKAISIIEDGGCFGIFPQGHRYAGENPRNTKTKNGMALIATKTHSDVVPCYIYRKKNKFRLFRRTYVIIGEKIPFDSLGYDAEASGEYIRITDEVFDKICSLGENFEKELAQKKRGRKNSNNSNKMKTDGDDK